MAVNDEFEKAARQERVENLRSYESKRRAQNMHDLSIIAAGVCHLERGETPEYIARTSREIWNELQKVCP